MSSNEHVVKALSELLADTYTLYLETHEKNAWMLRSHLEEGANV